MDIVQLALLDRLGGSDAPVLITTAISGEGVPGLVDVIR